MKVLSVFATLWCVVFSLNLNLLCELNLPAVAPSPTDIAEITRYLESLNFGPKILETVGITELETLKEANEYKTASQHEDVKLTATEILTKYGYNVERHNVTTEDGYILGVFRIPGSGPAVFVQHGLLASSDDFITAGPTPALVYYLADEGYDVWLGNFRGNVYSRAHETLDPDCADFWDFSWHEMGVYDLPAMIDYALQISNQSSVSYVGFSQGTTTISVLCSEKPEFNDKFKAIIEMAPVVFMGHIQSPFIRLTALINSELYSLAGLIGLNEFFPNNLFTTTVKQIICADNPFSEIVCGNILFLLGGFDRGNLNITSLPVEISHTIVGASAKTLVHYAQNTESNEFTQFDYGADKNLEKYGSEKAPAYNLSQISAPVAMFYSDSDWFSNKTDTDRLKGLLPNVVKYKLVKSFNHYDYIYAGDIRTKLYDDVLDIIHEYSSK